MRWKKKHSKEPRYIAGNTRTKEKFLLFPRCLPSSNDVSDLEIYEWRWLEKLKSTKDVKIGLNFFGSIFISGKINVGI